MQRQQMRAPKLHIKEKRFPRIGWSFSFRGLINLNAGKVGTRSNKVFKSEYWSAPGLPEEKNFSHRL
jgi:hypothetical protein